MSLFKTEHQRKASLKTALIMALLLVSFFLVGLTYLDPPEELGIEINFGTSYDGQGDIQPLTTKPPQNQPQQVEEQTSNTVKTEPVLTQDSEEETPVMSDTKNKPKTDPKPDTSESDNALNNILGAPSTTDQASTGEGDGQGSGDKGQIDGNPYANAYYGNGGGSGFGLNGRHKQSNQVYKPECNETGRVVVQIEVDKSGKVIKATPGVKGTTNTASCLMEPARKTALSYRFNSDNKAPNTQIGFVVVDFRLGAQ